MTRTFKELKLHEKKQVVNVMIRSANVGMIETSILKGIRVGIRFITNKIIAK